MAVNRVLYATQTVRLGVGANAGTWYALPAQSANADETIPQDDVLVLGKLGGVARLQKDVASSKASIKAYICQDVTENSTATHVEVNNLGGVLELFIADAASGNAGAIVVNSSGQGNANDGFWFEGTLSSIGIDASKGAFPMIDLGFDGVGRLRVLNMGTTSTLPGQNAGSAGFISAATPATSEDVRCTGSVGDTVSSVKFSYDMPTETLSALGSTIQGSSNNVAAGNKVFSKPPFKASITADGQDMNLVDNQWRQAAAGGVSMWIVDTGPSASNAFNAIISSAVNVSTRSFSQNVGDIGATYSVTAEGTLASFN